MLSFNSVIGTSLTNIYTVPSGKLCNINNMRIHNTANSDWSIGIHQYNKTTNTTTVLYSLSLKAGQILNDSTVYQLSSGDMIKGISDLTTVTISINGNEYASNT